MSSSGASRLILASNSPRRRQLLIEAGYDFEVVAPRTKEVLSSALTLCETTSWNALRKGLAVSRAYPGAVVIAADTLVGLEHEIIGKPRDLAAARGILQRLSGRTHRVVSSVFVGHLRAGKVETFSVGSSVVFRRLNRRLIDDYLARIEPLDKAGAYAAQGDGNRIIAQIIGSRNNVIGLPLEETEQALRNFGVGARA